MPDKRDKYSVQRKSGNLKSCEVKKAPIHANAWHFSSDQRLEAFADQSLDEVTTLYVLRVLFR